MKIISSLKITSLSVLGGALLLSVASGCGSDKTKQEKTQTVEFESYAFSRIAEDTSDEIVELPGAKYALVAGQGVLPVRIGDTDISALRDTLQKLGLVTFPSSGNPSPVLTDNWKLTDMPDTVKAGNSRYDYLWISFQTPDVIVWRDYTEEYNAGAAHGIHSVQLLNYSLISHKILSLDDIFKPGYQTRLLELIREKLKDNPLVEAEPYEINIPRQWCFTPQGIAFLYQEYEIAPYSAGRIQVDFYAMELDDLLSDEALKLTLSSL